MLYPGTILASSTDLAGRMARLTSEAGPVAIILLLTVAVGCVALLTFKKTNWMIAGYCVALMFSGHFIDAVDTATTLLRWGIIGLLLLSSVNGTYRLGTICTMLSLHWGFSIYSVVWTPTKTFGLQLSVLSLAMTAPAALAMSYCYRKNTNLDFVPRCLCLAAALFVANGVVGFSSLTGGRFSGATTSAPLFVITGGILMPTLLWGYFNLDKVKLRNACAVGCLCVFGLCLLSGQRTGFFAGVIGCIPVLARFGAKRLAQGIFVLVASVVIGLLAIRLFPEQADFLERRYNVTNFTGREYAWKWSLIKIQANPLVGYGAGSHSIRAWGFHNAFLQEWHNAGILGLILFSGAFLVALVKSTQLSFFSALKGHDRELARLMLGWSVTLIMGGFFESKLTSPSNILAFCIVQIGIILTHLEQRQRARI